MNKTFVIKSNSRGLYFIAIHSFTPMYGEKEKAKPFPSVQQAESYANKELFTTPAAFTIEDSD